MIVVNGVRSQIAQEFVRLIEGDVVEPWVRGTVEPPAAERYLFCQGVLEGLTAEQHTETTALVTFEANFLQIAAACDRILGYNPGARIVVIGSESGFEGSYDPAYAGAKAALHLYVETKKLLPDQQLVAIAPGIIGDAGMTVRRKDQRELARRMFKHPKQRFVTAEEVARVAHFLLYVDRGYITSTVIRMNGGEHARR